MANSAVRSLDVDWVSRERWEAISEKDWQKFVPLCPDFVVEIHSMSDDLKLLKDKMEGYRDDGCRLGWLIDRAGKQAFAYRENDSIDIRHGDTITVSGEDVLPEVTVQIEL